MNRTAAIPNLRTGARALREELLAWAIGLAFTFVLFLGMAHFENFGSEEPPVDIEDNRLVSVPFEAPPPPPQVVQTNAVPSTMLPFSGFEVAPSDSPVSIAVVPPDLETLIPTTTTPPKAMVQFGQLHTEFKPRIELEVDAQHIYQESEVDQLPRAMVRATPNIPRDVRGDARTLRVVLMLVIDPKGKTLSARVGQSSGNAKFDAIVARTVKEEWLFSPAMRRGKKVKCLAQQAFRVNFSSGSPFETR